MGRSGGHGKVQEAEEEEEQAGAEESEEELPSEEVGMCLCYDPKRGNCIICKDKKLQQKAVEVIRRGAEKIVTEQAPATEVLGERPRLRLIRGGKA